MVKVILDWNGWRKEMDIDNRYAVMGEITLPIPIKNKDVVETKMFRYRGRKVGIKPIFKADV